MSRVANDFQVGMPHVHVEGFGLQSCKSLHLQKKIQLDANHIHTESAGKTEAISMCTDNKQPLNLELRLGVKSSCACCAKSKK